MFQTTNQSLVQSIRLFLKLTTPQETWGYFYPSYIGVLCDVFEHMRWRWAWNTLNNLLFPQNMYIDMCHMYVYRSCSREPFRSFRWKGRMGWVKNYNRIFIDIYWGMWIHYLANLMCQRVLTREITGRSGRRFSNPQWAWSSPYRDPTDRKRKTLCNSRAGNRSGTKIAETRWSIRSMYESGTSSENMALVVVPSTYAFNQVMTPTAS